jgi:hypothetical protein
VKLPRIATVTATAVLLVGIGPAAHAGKAQTSPVSVLNGQTVQCSAANYRKKTASVELTVFCDGAAFLGPAVREIAPSGRGNVFGTNTGPNGLCYCALSFKGSGGGIRGGIQVYDGNDVVERAEAR